jgi:hypothetical protein
VKPKKHSTHREELKPELHKANKEGRRRNAIDLAAQIKEMNQQMDEAFHQKIILRRKDSLASYNSGISSVQNSESHMEEIDENLQKSNLKKSSQEIIERKQSPQKVDPKTQDLLSKLSKKMFQIPSESFQRDPKNAVQNNQSASGLRKESELSLNPLVTEISIAKDKPASLFKRELFKLATAENRKVVEPAFMTTETFSKKAEILPEMQNEQSIEDITEKKIDNHLIDDGNIISLETEPPKEIDPPVPNNVAIYPLEISVEYLLLSLQTKPEDQPIKEQAPNEDIERLIVEMMSQKKTPNDYLDDATFNLHSNKSSDKMTEQVSRRKTPLGEPTRVKVESAFRIAESNIWIHNLGESNNTNEPQSTPQLTEMLSKFQLQNQTGEEGKVDDKLSNEYFNDLDILKEHETTMKSVEPDSRGNENMRLQKKASPFKRTVSVLSQPEPKIESVKPTVKGAGLFRRFPNKEPPKQEARKETLAIPEESSKTDKEKEQESKKEKELINEIFKAPEETPQKDRSKVIAGNGDELDKFMAEESKTPVEPPKKKPNPFKWKPASKQTDN